MWIPTVSSIATFVNTNINNKLSNQSSSCLDKYTFVVKIMLNNCCKFRF